MDAIKNPLLTVQQGYWGEWYLDLSLMAPSALRENMRLRWEPYMVMRHHELNEIIGHKRLGDSNNAFFRSHALLERMMQEYDTVELTAEINRQLVTWWQDLDIDVRKRIVRNDKSAVMKPEHATSLVRKAVKLASAEVEKVGRHLRAHSLSAYERHNWADWALEILARYFPSCQPSYVDPPEWVARRRGWLQGA